MQKRIKKDLPKYTEALQKKLGEWLTECGEDFYWKGEAYARVIDRQEAEWTVYKDSEAQAKAEKKMQEKARYSGVGGIVGPSLSGGGVGGKIPSVAGGTVAANATTKGVVGKSLGAAPAAKAPVKPLQDARSRQNSLDGTEPVGAA